MKRGVVDFSRNFALVSRKGTPLSSLPFYEPFVRYHLHSHLRPMIWTSLGDYEQNGRVCIQT